MSSSETVKKRVPRTSRRTGNSLVLRKFSLWLHIHLRALLPVSLRSGWLVYPLNTTYWARGCHVAVSESQYTIGNWPELTFAGRSLENYLHIFWSKHSLSLHPRIQTKLMQVVDCCCRQTSILPASQRQLLREGGRSKRPCRNYIDSIGVPVRCDSAQITVVKVG